MRSSRVRFAAAVVVVIVAVIAVAWLARDRDSSGASGDTASSDTGSGEPASGPLAVGDAAPAVRLAATNGETIDLNDLRGKRDVLLYFYEHAG